MKSFKEFNEEYLFLESIARLDERLFKPILEGKYELSPEKQREWENKNIILLENSDDYNEDDEEPLDLDERHPNSKLFGDPDEEDERDEDEGDEEDTGDETEGDEDENDDEDDAAAQNVKKEIAKNPGQNQEKNGRSFKDDKWEKQQLKIYQKNPHSPAGEDALTALVENKMPYIYYLVNMNIQQWPNHLRDKDDLVSIGSHALLDCAEKFDVNAKNTFTSFFKRTFQGHIMNFYNPDRQKSVTAGKNGVSMVSIDDVIPGANGDKDQKIGDMIPDESGENASADMSKEEQITAMKDWIEALPEEEKVAINMYFPMDGSEPATLEEIAGKIGKSTMGAQKIVKRVIKKLKEKASEKGFIN